MQNSLVPVVIERTSAGERSFDIFSRMLRDRTVFMTGPVNDQMADVLIAQLLYLESEGDSDITMVINSPGGSVTAGLAIYDTLQFIKPDVATIVVGQAASMGSFIAQAGAAGKRAVLPSSRTMVHRVSSGTSGTQGSVYVQELQFEDARRSFEEAQRLNEYLTEKYVKHNTAGKTYLDFKEVMKYDTFLSAADAVKFGLADVVKTNR